jgi:hypothetical protein
MSCANKRKTLPKHCAQSQPAIRKAVAAMPVRQRDGGQVEYF